jgi:hypothetical protein
MSLYDRIVLMEATMSAAVGGPSVYPGNKTPVPAKRKKRSRPGDLAWRPGGVVPVSNQAEYGVDEIEPGLLPRRSRRSISNDQDWEVPTFVGGSDWVQRPKWVPAMMSKPSWGMLAADPNAKSLGEI